MSLSGSTRRDLTHLDQTVCPWRVTGPCIVLLSSKMDIHLLLKGKNSKLVFFLLYSIVIYYSVLVLATVKVCSKWDKEGNTDRICTVDSSMSGLIVRWSVGNASALQQGGLRSAPSLITEEWKQEQPWFSSVLSHHNSPSLRAQHCTFSYTVAFLGYTSL